MLSLIDPAGGQWYATIRGGAEHVRKPPSGAEPIPLRGHDGSMFTTGAGYTLFWDEAGCPYQVGGGLTLEDALLLAEALEPVTLDTWQQRLNVQSQRT